MPMDEEQKKNLMVVAAVGGGGLLLFMVMKNKGTTINPPVQAQSSPGSGIGDTTSYLPFTPPSPTPGPRPSGCHPPITGCPPGTTWNPDICACFGGGPDPCAPQSCPSGQAWSTILCMCVPSPHLPPNLICQGNAVGGGCPAGYHCENGYCVPDGPGQTPRPPNVVADMHVPMFGAAKGGGVNPVAQVGKRTDSYPAAYNDGTDAVYDWNLLSAYYSMRFH